MNDGVHIRVEGRVQGVGYRYFAMEKALALRVTGWVRNLPDGNVEIEAEGPRRTLERFMKLLRDGPALAQVAHLNAQWHPATGGFQTFDVR